jgi:hypothetical protein
MGISPMFNSRRALDAPSSDVTAIGTTVAATVRSTRSSPCCDHSDRNSAQGRDHYLRKIAEGKAGVKHALAQNGSCRM